MVDWKSSFDAKGAPDADAEGVIAGIFKAGLDQIAAMNPKASVPRPRCSP